MPFFSLQFFVFLKFTIMNICYMCDKNVFNAKTTWFNFYDALYFVVVTVVCFFEKLTSNYGIDRKSTDEAFFGDFSNTPTFA